jgi:hypothetical protein
MTGYPNSGGTGSLAGAPVTDTGSVGDNAAAAITASPRGELLTGSEVPATPGKDSLGNTTLNNQSPSGKPVGPWLKDVPFNPNHYRIQASNDGNGTITVLDGDGNVVGSDASACNGLP